MKLLLNQGLPLSAAALLRDAGIDTIHVGEIEMSEAEDPEILQRAKEEERVVATLDADFHTLLALDEAIVPSVMRIRIERLRAQALTDLLLRVISECEEDLQTGAAVTVEPSRIRGCLRSEDCCPNRPPTPHSGGLKKDSKSPRMGDLGGECKVLDTSQTSSKDSSVSVVV